MSKRKNETEYEVEGTTMGLNTSVPHNKTCLSTDTPTDNTLNNLQQNIDEVIAILLFISLIVILVFVLFSAVKCVEDKRKEIRTAISMHMREHSDEISDSHTVQPDDTNKTSV